MSRKADEAEAALDGVREACAAETASAQKALDDKTSSDLAPLTEKLSEAEAAVREVRDELDVVLDGPRAAQTELEAVEAKLQNADEERDAKEEKLRTAKKDVADLRKKASTYEKQLGEDGSLVKKRRQAESARDAALQRLEDAKALLQRQKESNNKASNSVVGEVLKAARKGSLSSCGVCGRLGDLGSIDPKYDVAVSTAADMLDHVVVETAQGGQKCIEFLRAKNLGRANFIVLDQVKKAKGKPQTPDNAPRLLDLIEISDPKYADAFAMTLRDTLVAESLDEAVKLAYRPDNSRWRVVTTKGQLIDTSGTMSGGGGKPRQGRMLLDGEATVAIAHCQQEDEIKEKDLPPLEKACVKATKEAEKASDAVRVAEEALSDLERQIRRLEDLVMPTLEAEIHAVEATCKQLQPRLETLRKATVVDAATKKKCAALEKKLGTLEASRDKAKKAFDVVDAEVQELRAAVVDAGGDPLRKALAKAEICRQLADDASNEVESIAVQVKAAEKALKKARKAYDKADADATRLKEDVDGSQEELERIASEKDDVVQAKKDAQQACDSAANALSVKKAELETLSQDADAIKAVEVDIQNQVDDYARALKDNGKKQKQCDALLKELRAEHAAEVRDFAQVFQEMDARKKEEAREAALVGGAAPMDEDAPAPVPEEGAMDEDAAPADADADAPPPVPEEGDGAAPAEPEAAAAPPPAPETPETDERPWETLPTLDTETLESADKEQIKYDIAVLEEERDRLKKICNLDTIRQYREKESEYQDRLKELEQATDVRNTCREKLEDLRKKRLDEFMAGFARITLKLKEMYQMITLGGDAELELVDSLDPFSEGVVFSVRPPKKSWKHIANLSGGEKTLSSLALVFALHHYKPTPLYVMDEIDAALDYKNVSIIANYIKDRCTSAQFVNISLRNNMFELADRLTGVYKTHNVTKTITISPSAFAATLSGLPAPPSNALGDATNTAVAAQ